MTETVGRKVGVAEEVMKEATSFLAVPRGILSRQWPWWTAGVLTGLAEVINFAYKHKFIGVTSGMARMLAAVESTLTGGSLIATKPDYQPNINRIILGALVAAYVFAWLERDLRSWVVYPKPMLVTTAIGAFLFAWGTRIAGGCTLHHLLGGFPAFNLKSIVVMSVSTLGVFTGFIILRALRVTPYFKAQDTKWYVSFAKKAGTADGLTLKIGYNPGKDLLRLTLYAFWVVFAVVIIYNAFFGNTYAVEMGWADSLEKTRIYKHMIRAGTIDDILILLSIGALLGIAVAKTGIGTECALINPEFGIMLSKNEKKVARQWRIPFHLRTTFLSMGPLVALAIHIIVAGLAFWAGFTFFGILEKHNWFVEQGFTAKVMRNIPNLPLDLLGGFMLGLGTIFMLGCEFRNYARTGLLYITGLLIWPFFYLGYLPYTLARDFWDSIWLDPKWAYASTTFVPALITENETLQSLIWLLWILLWVGVLVWALRFGAKNLGVNIKDLLVKDNDVLAVERLARISSNEKEYKELMSIEEEVSKSAAPA